MYKSFKICRDIRFMSNFRLVNILMIIVCGVTIISNKNIWIIASLTLNLLDVIIWTLLIKRYRNNLMEEFQKVK